MVLPELSVVHRCLALAACKADEFAAQQHGLRQPDSIQLETLHFLARPFVKKGEDLTRVGGDLRRCLTVGESHSPWQFVVVLDSPRNVPSLSSLVLTITPSS